jgi:metal-responsive CopG/Arc/MetJ family transcriptional regulator
MKKAITKNRISVSIDKKLDDILNDEFNNKSKYIEWLIYQDLLKNSKNDKIKTILI